MTSAFSFSFSGDDIDENESPAEERDGALYGGQVQGSLEAVPPTGIVPARRHTLKELITTLPSQISYNTLSIAITDNNNNDDDDDYNNYNSPDSVAVVGWNKNETQNKNDMVVEVGRREIFDIRAQLMAEDEPDNEQLISSLEAGDIQPWFYEGGFKTWECALDLARYVLSHRKDILFNADHSDGDEIHILELGCGTAIPSLALFAYLLAGGQFSSSSSSLSSEQSPANAKPNIRFTFADYNSTVLRLVTMPNLLLTWKLACNRRNRKQNETVQNQQQDQQDEDGEQDINLTMLNDFEKDLQQRGILIDFVSGAWSPEFVHMAIDSVSTASCVSTEDAADTRRLASSRSRCRLLVLASETIYAPASLTTFSETLVALLRVGTSDNGTTNQQTSPPPSSRALLAAKKVYFGVGGGIDEFLTVLNRVRGGTGTVQQRSEVKTEGVGRVILEISF